ncbi:MAG: hypothetical protein KA715_02140 [Xanthomonadaceae bacterium]|nr:hypothetical protein [Xanthomonadaceae bacterium]
MNLNKESVPKLSRLEELVKEAPSVTDLEKATISGVIEKFIIPVMQLGCDVLWAEYDRAEDLLAQCLKIFESKIFWGETLIGMIKSQRGTQEAIPLQEAIRMAGIHNTRLYLIACHLAELIPSKELAKDPKSGRFMNRVPQILKHTAQVNQAFPDDTRYYGTAQCAGLLYDFLSLLETTFTDRSQSKKFNDQLTLSITESVAQAGVAINLAKARTRMVLEKQIPATLLLANAGKAVLGLLQPAYFDHIKKIEKFKVPPSIDLLIQRQFFGIDHLQVASILSQAFEPIKTIGRSLNHLYAPFELDSKLDADQYDLSCIAHLSIYSSQNMAKVSAMDGKPAQGLRPEFRRFDLIIKAVAFKKKEKA